jgi:hypothetical protein
MQTRSFRSWTVAGLVCLLPLAALAELPRRDLTVELRQVQEGEESGGYSVGMAPREPTLAPQQVRVRNGEKARLQMTQSMPVLWAQKVEGQTSSLSVGGATASSSGGGVTQAVTWMEAGQSLAVTPRWPGGKQPARVEVEVEVQTAAVDERTGSELPATGRQQLVTTVTAPLRQWVTIATSGSAAQPGVYSSTANASRRRLLQIRVLDN